MISIDCNQPTYWDVDDTLIMWNPTPEQLDRYGIEYTDAAGFKKRFMPHLPHIEQLKKHSDRGHTIIVWSAGGSKWAELAVKILGLEAYVSVTIAKPLWYYDDKQPEDFLGKPQYLPVQS